MITSDNPDTTERGYQPVKQRALAIARNRWPTADPDDLAQEALIQYWNVPRRGRTRVFSTPG